MKVPFSSNDNVSSKPLISNNNNNNNLRNATFPAATNGPNLCYEPKSVLELRRSPSPIVEKQVITNPDFSALCGGDDPLQLGDHVLSNFEDWDSLMRELGLQDDSASLSKSNNPQLSLTQSESLTQFHNLSEFSADSTQFPTSDFSFSENFPQQFQSVNQGNFSNALDLSGDIHQNNWNVGFDYVDELIRFAECFEANAFQLAHVILARLNQRLRSAAGKPLQRAAFYFKEALQAQLAGSTRQTRPASSSDVIQTIKSYKIFSNISPIPMFSSFTANQAVLEAVDGSMLVHVIDFDIGLGGHWASFMKELADKAECRKANAPVLRITALVPEEYAVESRLIRENLTQFARELNIGFEIDFVLIRTFELLSFKAIKFMDGEKTAVLLSPAIFRRIGSGFVNDLRRISPNMVVHVDSEGLMGYGTASFRQTVIDGLEFYSTLLESLEAANIGGGNCGDWMRKIENFVLFPKIVEMVAAVGRRGGGSWKDAMVAAGFRPVGLSQFADFQADCLLGRVQVRGFHVAKRQAEMLLCWHDRALVATSAWRC
ncbi:PREDICTED: scarecrow-like protein 15 [Nicotiana attenuata]|uniref:Scarecrow-like protein 15 n=1 Tax=Nicotiana attenuata TaxID=49451 RepID=A0A1J6IQ72_NICAT|nr:PREDICTED: scarecrow-like protein 15 [Nicotiana attenuata]OIT06404.1 scarecrow-like protein 15 [Nicotiana attenuata]